KFAAEGDDVVAELPVDPTGDQTERGGRVGDEGDVRGRRIDEPRDGRAHALRLVVPGQEIRTGQLIAMREVARDGVDRAARDLAVGRAVEVGPMGKGGKLRAN